MENNGFKYNYILYNMENGYKWQTYAELQNKDFVRMCKGALPMNEPLLHKLHKLHWSAKLNRKINLPFKKLWFKRMTKGNFQDDKPVCFILYGGQYAIRDPRLCDYIKSLNPQNKIAVHYRDLLKNDAKHLDMLKSKTDFIYTYDRGEAEKFGLCHYESHIYSQIGDVTCPEEFDYDLYFVGYPKDRLELLYKIHDTVSSKGIRCCFKLVGVAPEHKKDSSGLIYLDNPIPYKQVVSDISKTRCILEIVQENSTGATMRTLEAVTYKRKLITNRKDLAKSSLFAPAQISQIDDPSDIDIEFLRSAIPYKELKDASSFSPLRELEFVEQHLN